MSTNDIEWVLEDLAEDLAEFKNLAINDITEILENEKLILSYFDDCFDGAHITEENRHLYSEWTKKTEYYLYSLARWYLTESESRTRTGRKLPEGLGLKCLDFGSGIGIISLFYTLKKWDVTLCDINRPCLEFSKFRYKKNGLKGSFTEEINHIDYFDRVILFDTIGHLEEPEKNLRSLILAMKNGGILEITWDLFENPARDHLWNRKRQGDFMLFMKKEGLKRADRGKRLWRKSLTTKNML